jgi:hypothetical protein
MVGIAHPKCEKGDEHRLGQWLTKEALDPSQTPEKMSINAAGRVSAPVCPCNAEMCGRKLDDNFTFAGGITDTRRLLAVHPAMGLVGTAFDLAVYASQ